jgi:hypothetical protein
MDSHTRRSLFEPAECRSEYVPSAARACSKPLVERLETAWNGLERLVFDQKQKGHAGLMRGKPGRILAL